MIEPGQVLNTIADVREAIKLQRNGVAFECRDVGANLWIGITCGFNDLEKLEYRRAPKTSLVPLSVRDIPVLSLLRKKSWSRNCEYAVLGRNNSAVVFLTNGEGKTVLLESRTPAQLMEQGWEFRSPGGDRWMPCSMEVRGE